MSRDSKFMLPVRRPVKTIVKAVSSYWDNPLRGGFLFAMGGRGMMRALGLYDVSVNHPLPSVKSNEKAGDTLLKKDEVFEKANSYQFDCVKEYLEQGGNAEIYDEYGSSLLTALLDA